MSLGCPKCGSLVENRHLCSCPIAERNRMKVVMKIQHDLCWKGPNTKKPLAHIVLTRQEAIDLLGHDPSVV